MRALLRTYGSSALHALLLATLVVASVGVEVRAQAAPPVAGTLETALMLRQLDGEKRVLMVGAHPDDEDTALLAALSRGAGAQVAYLSLSRGEGGQNLIGPELGEGLGLIRTGELLAARSLDGARQYFSRAFDFGYSKNAEETFGHWPEDELVRDVVWVIRSFRPQVIVSVFSGTPRDGHGQHQAAGIATRRAFEVAGDTSRFPDQLRLGLSPWSPQRLYLLERGGGPDSDVVVATGRLDPLLGRSYFQVAMDSRSQHRSQDMGVPQTPGSQRSGATILARRPGTEQGLNPPEAFFTGVDTTLAGVVRQAEIPNEARLLEVVDDYRGSIAEASRSLDPFRPGRSLPALLDAVEYLQEGREALAEAEPTAVVASDHLLAALRAREQRATTAALSAAGVVVDVRLDRDRMVPGDRVDAELSIWNGGEATVTVHSASVDLPDGWSATDAGFRQVTLLPGAIERWTFEIQVPTSAAPSQPYFLREDRDGDLYRWPADAERMARPGNPALISGEAMLSIGDGPRMDIAREGTFVGVDKASGEFRLPVYVTPAISVEAEPAVLAWPIDRTDGRSISVRVANLSQDPLATEVRLETPGGWQVTPDQHRVELSGAGGSASVSFEIRPDGAPEGPSTFAAVARAGGRSYDAGVTMIDYPHIDPVPLIRPAQLSVSRFPVSIAEDLRVGYVMGSGDAGLDALSDLGVSVETLGPERLGSADLGRFDTIVLGIRAYETRPDLVAANDRILDFTRAGGTVVVQYNKYEYPAGGFAPYPVEMARPHDRVTNPEAAVVFLEPDHPAVTTPNRLTSADFEGWTQERGLYFLNQWDDRYVPLLEMSDAGEEPAHGSLVVAPVGEGAYVYTGLALFRQLPEGVPGSYRLLANLVSLRGSDL